MYLPRNCCFQLWLLISINPAVFVNGLDLSFLQQRLSYILGSGNPCYIRDRTQPSANDCESIVIPTGFCETCGISTAVRSNGNYNNCLYTSGVESIDGTVNMACLDQIQSYVDMNPCDPQRATGLRRYRSKLSLPHWLRRLRTTSRQIMDSLVYAVCELACDCIPQFNVSITQRALDFQRGNCQGHVLYDVCQVYPNIKLVRGENGTTPASQSTDLSTLQTVCPYVRDWRQNHPGAWMV
jgi:hypothetical protein